MLINTEIVNINDEMIRYNFEGTGHQQKEIMFKWLDKLLESQYWEVRSGGVRIIDDVDVPIQKNFDYETLDSMLNDMEHIKTLDLEPFYLIGEYEGEEVSVSTSIYENKHISIYLSYKIDAEIFLKKMNIE